MKFQKATLLTGLLVNCIGLQAHALVTQEELDAAPMVSCRLDRAGIPKPQISTQTTQSDRNAGLEVAEFRPTMFDFSNANGILSSLRVAYMAETHSFQIDTVSADSRTSQHLVCGAIPSRLDLSSSKFFDGFNLRINTKRDSLSITCIADMKEQK